MAKTYKPSSSLLADPAEEVAPVIVTQPAVFQPVHFAPSFNNGDDISVQSTVTNQDSFNSTRSNVRSQSDSGNASLSIGGGATGAVSEYGPLLFAIFGLLGGLYLITK